MKQITIKIDTAHATTLDMQDSIYIDNVMLELIRRYHNAKTCFTIACSLVC